MRFRATLTLSTGNSFDLIWLLNDAPWTRSWVNVTRRALLAGHQPTGMQIVVPRNEDELSVLRAELLATAHLAVEQGFLPAALIEADLREQAALNALHAALHLNEDAVPPVMNRLNILVHMIESGMRPSRGGYLVSYLAGGEVFRDPIPAEWLIEGDTPPEFGDLRLGYGTVGKRLVDCFYDKDEAAVAQGLVRPQETLCPEVLMEFREPLVLRGRREAFEAWCERVGAEAAGYPWRGTVHGAMDCPRLGTLMSPSGFTPELARDILANTRAVSGFALI